MTRHTVIESIGAIIFLVLAAFSAAYTWQAVSWKDSLLWLAACTVFIDRVDKQLDKVFG